MSMSGNGLFTRRRLMMLTAIGASLAGVRHADAQTSIGQASDIRGDVTRSPSPADGRLKKGAALMENDTVATGAKSFAGLALGTDTKVLLGSDTSLTIDSFIIGQGGTLELGTGQLVFDRPEGLVPVDVSLRTAFGMIGVRGTKFFCGKSRGKFAVFVEHGEVSVANAGVTRRVGRGEGVDIAAADQPPTVPVKWGAPRIAEAYRSVGIAAD